MKDVYEKDTSPALPQNVPPVTSTFAILSALERKNTILVLDLDLTSFQADGDKRVVHPIHCLSESEIPLKLFYKRDELLEVKAYIINSDELAILIRTAHEKCGGMMVLTSGCYESTSVLNLLAECTGGSEALKEQVRKSYFHSPVTDRAYFPDLTIGKIQVLDKGIRLKAIVKNNSSLQNKNLVLFDDDHRHIKFCNNLEAPNFKVKAIHATTRANSSGSMHCYELVHRALMSFAREYELGRDNSAKHVVSAVVAEQRPPKRTKAPRLMNQSFSIHNGVVSITKNNNSDEAFDEGYKKAKVSI